MIEGDRGVATSLCNVRSHSKQDVNQLLEQLDHIQISTRIVRSHMVLKLFEHGEKSHDSARVTYSFPN